MNRFLNKLELKYGKFAIRNLTSYMIVMYVAGYVMQLVAGNVLYNYLTLDIYQITQGQVWRLVTWLFMPPGALGIFTIFMLMLYYWLGNMLERQWGAFKYNLFIFSGIFFTIIGAVIVYLYFVFYIGNTSDAAFQLKSLSAISAAGYNTYFINTSIFLAFASIFPDVQLYLYFIIPVKIKWLAALDVALIIYSFIRGNLVSRVSIAASLLNVLLFIIAARPLKKFSGFRQNGNAQRTHNVRENKAASEYAKMFHNGRRGNDAPLYKHKCCICGRTDVSHPELEFRFCSKCKGAHEYCNDHLFTHIHEK